jgi:succinylarginine dihydrolase
VPPDSVRCTRENHSKLATFGNSGSHSAIIHRTVRCAKRSNGYMRQRSSATATGTVNSARLCAQSQSRRQMAHRTVNRTCLVHHRTVQWPTCQKLQRSNPNGWVTWLAHRTVSSGAPDCLVRHTTTAFPNDHFGGWGL